MADFSITIADSDVLTVLTALCRMNGYEQNNPDGLTLAEYANRVVRNYIRSVVEADAVAQAATALQAARDSVAGISITDPQAPGVA